MIKTMNTCYADKETRSIADLMEFRDRFIITRINVPIEHRGQGYGRRLLNAILADADDLQIPLYLEIQPSGELGFRDLENWYVRNGFVRGEPNTPDTGLYKRAPR